MEYGITIGAEQLLSGVSSRIVYEGSICATFPCWNEGVCIQGNSSKTDYTCQCNELFVGSHCQVRVFDLCLQGNCTPGTSCTVDGFDINCPKVVVKEFLTSCLTTVCMNGGQCMDKGHGHRCFCVAPYQGPFCQYESSSWSSQWSLLEVGLICVLIAMIATTLMIICCSGNIGFYVSVPNKRYSRWEEGDVSDDDEEREIALGDMKTGQLRISKTSETIVGEENEISPQPNLPSSSRYGVVSL